MNDKTPHQELTAHILEAAIRVAVDLFSGSYDKNGEPYILHLLSGLYNPQLTKNADPELNDVIVARAAFVVHDVIEDIPGMNKHMLKVHLLYNYIQLLAKGAKMAPEVDPAAEALLDRIAGVVEAVSKRRDERGKRGYLRFMKRVMEYHDPAAEWVKRADIDHNTEPSRLACLDEGERNYLTRKYEYALEVLNAESYEEMDRLISVGWE